MTPRQHDASIKALEDALACFRHNQSEMARRTKVSRQTVHGWLIGAHVITLENARELQKATGGTVPWQRLRPDIAAFLTA